MKRLQSRSKLPKLSTIIDKADKAASAFIRQKFADFAGNISCCTCGKSLPWKESHCAHYIERAAKSLRWVEENLHPACPSCNVYRKEYHKREYTLYMIDMYGREKIEEFKELSRQVLSGSQVRKLAEEAIEYYSKGINESQ